MAMSSTKGSTRTVYPKTVSAIVALVGGLALFIILGSILLVLQPIGAAVREYFYGVDSLENIELKPPLSSPVYESNHTVNKFEDGGKSSSTVLGGSESNVTSHNGDQSAVSGGKSNSTVLEGSENNVTSQNGDRSAVYGRADHRGSLTLKAQADVVPQLGNGSAMSGGAADDRVSSTPKAQANVVDSGCDLYHGKWIFDPAGPLYSNNSCPVLTQMQNCQGNGRPDKDYENWRWKPLQCNLPRFDPKKFLELMRGKTLAFVGDSVARNQMESLLCILWQVEKPKNRGNKKMHRYYFRSTSTMIVRMWSSWLVRQTSEPFDFAPAGVAKIHLDAPDDAFMEYITSFDVIILSSGHWFAKQSVYILKNEIVGRQLWWPDKSRQQKINNMEAFQISVETILTTMGTHPNYTGLTIVRSYSPDHYEGGGWNTGGSCTGKVRPALEKELVESGFTNIMHKKQAMGFDSGMKKKTNKSKMIFMDITEAFSFRHDGHPGPYRNPDPNKKTKRGPDGKPPPQDCLHWCMPGPVDIWNEMVFEIIRREFNVKQNNTS